MGIKNRKSTVALKSEVGLAKKGQESPSFTITIKR